jgi:hypothetical protein
MRRAIEETNLDTGETREAVGAGTEVGANRLAEGQEVREVGPGQMGRIVLRRARARPQPTLAGYTRRSWGTLASGAEL